MDPQVRQPPGSAPDVLSQSWTSAARRRADTLHARTLHDTSVTPVLSRDRDEGHRVEGKMACQPGAPNMLANRRVPQSCPLKCWGFRSVCIFTTKTRMLFGAHKLRITQNQNFWCPEITDYENFRTFSVQQLWITKNITFDNHSGEGWLSNVR